jgi:TRAP-type C4-dicarboxylate transport system permease small subunit
MTEAREDDAIEPARGWQRWLYYVGAAGLLFAIGADALAVLGRHLGIPLLGSIELMQAAILLAASAAMVMATIAGKHAVVHLLIDRLAPRRRMLMERVHALLGAIFFAALAAGSIWIAFDLRNGHEQSELLRIPYAPLRIVSILAVLAVAAVYLARAFEKRAGP